MNTSFKDPPLFSALRKELCVLLLRRSIMIYPRGKMSMVEDTVPHRVKSTCVFSSYFCINVNIFTGYLVHNMT